MASSGRRLGAGSATALVIASTIGAGVFTTSGFALADLGTPARVLAAWLIGGVLALLGAVSYGALLQRMPGSGGEYHFLAAVHPLLGFMAGWVSLLAGFTAPIAAAAAALEVYVEGGGAAAPWLGSAVIAVAGLLHGVRRSGGATVQNAMVVIKLVWITGFVGFAAVRITTPPVVVTAPEFDLFAMGETLVWVSFSYSGWNAAVYLAGELRDPVRDGRRAMVWGTSAVVLLYFCLNAAFVYAAPIDELKVPDIAAVAAAHIGGDAMQVATRALIVLALVTSISAMVMAGPRVYARMAHDGLFPKWFAARGDAPSGAVALQVVLSLAVLWLGDLRELLTYIGFTLGLSTAATVAILFRLRRRDGPGGLRIPGYPWLPGVFIAANVAIALFLAVRRIEMFALGVASVLAGLPLYAWMFRRRGGTPSRGARGR